VFPTIAGPILLLLWPRAALTLAIHKLTRLIVINGHGGNAGPIQVATREVHRATGMLIPSLYLWRIGYALLPGIVGAALDPPGAKPLDLKYMKINEFPKETTFL